MKQFIYEVAGQQFENGADAWGEGFKWAKQISKETGCNIYRYKLVNGEVEKYEKFWEVGGVMLPVK